MCVLLRLSDTDSSDFQVKSSLSNFRGLFCSSAEQAVVMFFLDNDIDAIEDRVYSATQAVEVLNDPATGRPDVDRRFLWSSFGNNLLEVCDL